MNFNETTNISKVPPNIGHSHVQIPGFLPPSVGVLLGGQAFEATSVHKGSAKCLGARLTRAGTWGI